MGSAQCEVEYADQHGNLTRCKAIGWKTRTLVSTKRPVRLCEKHLDVFAGAIETAAPPSTQR